jgi:hypothetical protein
MNRSYSKIRHIQESNSRLERRMLFEQFNMDDMGTSSMDTSSDEPQTMNRPSEEDAQKSNLINNVIPMLEEIVNNFMDINCDNVGGGFEDYNKTPEYVQTYCRYYNGKTRSDIFQLLKRYKQQVGM